MPDITYHLSIAAGLESFRPEIEHVCGFLDACYHVRRVDRAERVLHYGSGGPTGAVRIPAVLFPAGVKINSEGIHPNRAALKPMICRGQLLPPDRTSPASSPLSYDALGLIFFMLSRVEERDYPERDRYQRFPVNAALIAPQNSRLYPVADQAARDIVAALTGDPDPPQRTRYEVMFTHDVDMLRGYHRPLEPLRNALGDVVKRGRPAAAWRRLRHAYFAGEPWISMRRLMALSERKGIKSHFYFLGPSDDSMDSPYVLRLPVLLRKVTEEIRARGHILGFHPGFHTFDDAAEWMRQRDGVEAIVGVPLREGRHHVLRYDCAITPRIWSDAGMTLDCTLAYPEAVGFRSGTCRPHQAYDLVARRTMPLKQLSTAVMEFGMFGGKYRDLSIDQAVADSRWAVEVCRRYGGTFNLLFHSGQQDAKLWRWLDSVIEDAAH